jgi:hypothetical protein
MEDSRSESESENVFLLFFFFFFFFGFLGFLGFLVGSTDSSSDSDSDSFSDSSSEEENLVATDFSESDTHDFSVSASETSASSSDSSSSTRGVSSRISCGERSVGIEFRLCLRLKFAFFVLSILSPHLALFISALQFERNLLAFLLVVLLVLVGIIDVVVGENSAALV